MFRPHAALIAVFLGLTALPGESSAQAKGEYHEFTDKRGQKVSAMLVGVTPDKRQMRIVRQDGQAFNTEIVLLCLDDQQYVKDWEKAVAAATGATTTSVPGTPPLAMSSVAAAGTALPDYRLEVTTTRAPGAGRKNRDDVYTMEEKENLFRIAVKNLSRESLVAARLEYAILWQDAVTIYQDKDGGDWNYQGHPSDEVPPLVKKLGAADLPEVRFNAEATVDTVAVSIDQVLYDGNELYREDEMVGVKVRILRPDGSVLYETDSGGADLAAITWEEISTLEDPRVID